MSKVRKSMTEANTYTRTCVVCEKEFEALHHRTSACSDECIKERTRLAGANQRQRVRTGGQPTVRVRLCIMCGQSFDSVRNRKVCSDECAEERRKEGIRKSNEMTREKKRLANEAKYADVPDIPTCKICGWKSRSLQGHLKTHNLTVEEYRRQHDVTNGEIFHSSYTDDKSERMSGENNPGWQHGGTMSPFSKNYALYEGMTEEDKEAAIAEQIAKASETKLENNSYATTLEYYTSRGYSLEEAEILRSERQTTFSLEICIEKYGEEAGRKRWEERQEKWLATLDALPEEEKKRIYDAKIQALSSTYSKISKEMFDLVVEAYDFDYLPWYGGSEKVITTPDGTFMPDFMHENKIIEFYGDFWHANPRKYGAEDTLNFPGYGGPTIHKASDIWEKDAVRINALKALGNEVLIIWERDYKNDPEGTIEKCLEFLRS